MQKFFASSLALVMAMSLTACSSSNSDSTDTKIPISEKTAIDGLESLDPSKNDLVFDNVDNVICTAKNCGVKIVTWEQDYIAARGISSYIHVEEGEFDSVVYQFESLESKNGSAMLFIPSGNHADLSLAAELSDVKIEADFSRISVSQHSGSLSISAKEFADIEINAVKADVELGVFQSGTICADIESGDLTIKCPNGHVAALFNGIDTQKKQNLTESNTLSGSINIRNGDVKISY